MNELLEIGTEAPDFALNDGSRLSSLRGSPVVLVFYPGDFTPVCTSQLALYNEALPVIERSGAKIIGISTDDAASHAKFSESQNLRFPLVADSDPKGRISASYNAYNVSSGRSARVLYVIDREGKIAWSHYSPDAVNPGVDGILGALKALQAREAGGDARPAAEPLEHVFGNPDANVTLIEYGDYQCPYCGDAHALLAQSLPQLKDQLRFIFRNFPLTQIHQYAELAAETAEAAAAQGKFWEMHDALFENQQRLSVDTIPALAEQQGLDMDRYLSELQSRQHMQKVRNDFERGLSDGVNGTPSFFLNGQRYEGGLDAESLAQAIRAAAN